MVVSRPIVVDGLSSGRSEVLVYGRGIEGTLSAVKRLVNARDVFLVRGGSAKTSFVDDVDPLGIGVYDRLHGSDSVSFFGENGVGLQQKVRKILFDNDFELSVLPVKTLNTTSYNESTVLRVKHVNTDFSDDYRDAIGISEVPVVFSGGLFGDLTRWELKDGLAVQLAQEGRGVWEIEVMGGSTTDCSNCPNYTYEDMVDYYWPASMAGIEEYSGKSTIQFVSISGGCRVALDSYQNWSDGKESAGYYFDFNDGTYKIQDLSVTIDAFVGAGCVGAFNGTSLFVEKMEENGEDALNWYSANNRSHTNAKTLSLKIGDYTSYTGLAALELLEDPRSVSVSTIRKIHDWIIDENDAQPGKDVHFDYVSIIRGTCNERLGSCSGEEESDGIIPTDDSIQIFNNLNASSNQSFITAFEIVHSGMPENPLVRKVIINSLNKEVLE